jgi:hypothetical protein
MVIDSKVAGLGDAWMRLMALYSLSALRRQERHTLLVSPALLGLARQMFGERFDIRGEGSGEVSYTHLGLRHIGWDLVRGRRYVFPFFWLRRKQRVRTTLKDRINDVSILAVSATGRLWLPDRTRQEAYQGYMELQALPPFRDVGREEFDAQAIRDFADLGPKFRASFPTPPGAGIVVFSERHRPSGHASRVGPAASSGRDFRLSRIGWLRGRICGGGTAPPPLPESRGDDRAGGGSGARPGDGQLSLPSLAGFWRPRGAFDVPANPGADRSSRFSRPAGGRIAGPLLPLLQSRSRQPSAVRRGTGSLRDLG